MVSKGNVLHFELEMEGFYKVNQKRNPLEYHNWNHTVQVLEAGNAIAKKEQVDEEDLFLVQTAIFAHDIGNYINREEHENIAINHVREVLPKFCYSKNEIEIIARLIGVTKMPHNPQTMLERIIVDADMSLMGLSEHVEKIDGFRLELGITNMQNWYEMQVKFLSNHTWFTDGAKELYDAQKQKNLEYWKEKAGINI